MADPLDDRQVKFFLDFVNDGTGRIQITEPDKFNDSNLTLQKEDKRLGIDVLFSNDEIDLEFVPNKNVYKDGQMLNHQFDKIIEYWDTYGFESEIKFIIEIRGVDTFVGELNFTDQTSTDLIKVFRCRAIQDTLQAKVKRRSDSNVDLFATEDLDGNTITAVNTESVLLKATPLKQTSVWNQVSATSIFHEGGNISRFTLTPATAKSEIRDTIPVEQFAQQSTGDKYKNAIFINAVDTLSNVIVDISEFTFDTMLDPVNDFFSFQWAKGADFDTATINTVSLPFTGTDYDFTVPIGTINRDENLWMWFLATNNDSGTDVTGTYSTCKIEANLTSTAIDSVTTSVRLVDAIQQVVTSIAGVNIDAPRFESGGEFYDQFIFTGTLIRGITSRAFNLTFDDILDYLKELNADYQVLPNNEIFFGIYEDFYTDNELGRYATKPVLNFEEGFNKRYLINKIIYKYKKYERGQNNEQQNSLEGVHTNCEMQLPNLRTKDTKEIEVPFIRDPFLIEKVRRQGIEVTEETAQEDDDDIIITDIYIDTGTMPRSEGMLVNHSIPSDTVLQISNSGGFSFNLLGMTINDQITITGENAGDYVVTGFTPGTLSLAPVSPTPNPTFAGASFITLDYNITATDFVLRTDQGFSLIEGTTDPEGFGNMRFTPKRNLYEFYGKYLATASEFHPTGTILNTKFLHNGAFTSQLDTETESIREDQNIDITDLSTAILTTKILKTQVDVNFDQAWSLMEGVRNTRGYVTIIDSKNADVKVHPYEMFFDWSKNILNIEGEIRV